MCHSRNAKLDSSSFVIDSGMECNKAIVMSSGEGDNLFVSSRGNDDRVEFGQLQPSMFLDQKGVKGTGRR